MGGDTDTPLNDDFWARMSDSGPSMSSEDIPPRSYSRAKYYIKGQPTFIAESEARAVHCSVFDRTLAAVFFAAHLSRREVFFVGQAARTKYNLSPNQLRKGLDQLEAKGVIQSEGSKKGRYRRVRFL